MRKVVSLSLSEAELQLMEQQVKKRGIASISAYVRFLLNQDVKNITEDELLQYAKEARKEYAAGKTEQLDSLADLM